MPSSAPAAKAALFTLCKQMFPQCQVTYGHPGPNQRDDIVSIGDIASQQSVATMNAQARPREENLAITVIVSCYRGGGPEVQQTVTERAYELCALLETELQTTSPTLSGTVRAARVTAHTAIESWDQATIEKGRVCEINMTVTCQARI